MVEMRRIVRSIRIGGTVLWRRLVRRIRLSGEEQRGPGLGGPMNECCLRGSPQGTVAAQIRSEDLIAGKRSGSC